MADSQFYGTGRRKSSTARIFLRPGTGNIQVNRRSLNVSFPTEVLRMQIQQPLQLTETLGQYDVLATATGGGVSGQAGALRLGIARALVKANPSLRADLKKAGFLRRDRQSARCLPEGC